MDGNELFIRTHERLIRLMLRRHPKMSEETAYDITLADASEEALRVFFDSFHQRGFIKGGSQQCSK